MGEVFRFNWAQKKFLTLWGVKVLMRLPMLKRLKKSSISSLITMRVNTDLYIRKIKYSAKGLLFRLFKIVTKVLVTRKSFYLRIMKYTNNLKKKKLFGNTHWKYFILSALIKKKKLYFFNHTQYIMFLAFTFFSEQIFYLHNNANSFIYNEYFLFAYLIDY